MKTIIIGFLLLLSIRTFSNEVNTDFLKNDCQNFPSDEFPLVMFCQNDSQMLIQQNGKYIFIKKNQFMAKLKYVLRQWKEKNPFESQKATQVQFGIFVPELVPERSQLIVLFLLENYSLMLNFDATMNMPTKLEQFEIKLADAPDISNSNKYFPGKVKVNFNKDINLKDLSTCLKKTQATGIHWRIYDETVWDVLVPTGQELNIQEALNQNKQCDGKKFIEYVDLDYASSPMGLSFSFSQFEL